MSNVHVSGDNNVVITAGGDVVLGYSVSRQNAVMDYCELLANRSVVKLPSAQPRGRRTPVSIAEIFIDPPVEVLHEYVAPGPALDRVSGSHLARLARAPQPEIVPTLDRKKSVAARLGPGRRLLVEGERGSGKSTLVQWLAYVCALRQLDDHLSAGAHSVPDLDWLPLVVMCRDLPHAVVQGAGNLGDLLEAQFTQLRAGEWIKHMLEQALSMLEEGRALLLVDGVDEIAAEDRPRFFGLLVAAVNAYPDAAMVVTSLPAGLDHVTPDLSDACEWVRMAPLGPEDKRRFARRWATAVSPAQAVERAEALSGIVTGYDNLARLTENVQMLSLVAELHLRSAAVPDRRPELVKRAVEVLLDRGGTGESELTWNEAFPVLGHLAYEMRRRRVPRLPEPEIHTLLANPALGLRGSPETFLRAVVEQTGLLVDAGTELDGRAMEQRNYRFVHQTFQDFFAAQALLHGHDRPGEEPTPRRQRLLGLLETLRVEERVVNNFAWREARETVFAEEWQGTFREFLPGLEQGEADEALFGLLHPSVTGTQPGEARARAVFAAACLADDTRVSRETAEAIIDALVENIQPQLDGFNRKRNTALDDAAYALARSSWRLVLQERLLAAYVEARGQVRSGVGAVLSASIMATELDTDAVDLPSLYRALTEIPGDDVSAQVFQSLRVMSYAFEWQERITAEHALQVLALVDDLLARLDGPEPVATAAAWAVSWLVQARYAPPAAPIRLRPEHAEPLCRFIETDEADPHALGNACLCLSRLSGVPERPDWIYSWAVVADGGKPWSALPRPAPVPQWQEVAHAISRQVPVLHPLAREGAAIALGRLGMPGAAGTADDLLRMFLDRTRGNDARDEALAFFVHSGAPGVEGALWDALAEPCDAGQQSYTPERAYLALIALGNLPSLERLVREGTNQAGIGDGRWPAALALGSHTDLRGRALLEDLANSPDPAIATVATDVLAGRKPDWTPDSAIILEPDNLLHPQPEHQRTLEKTVCIMLVMGENPEGGSIWVYVAVRADKVAEFMEAQKSGLFYPEDYGVIVEAGDGEPSPEIRKKMTDEYGFDHDNMIYFPDS
jgi:hypothetical protein